MAGVLLLYATTHGHTSKIAKRIARTLSAEGLDVDMRRVESAGDTDPGRHGGLIVAASLHRGRHLEEVGCMGEAPARGAVWLTAAEDSPDAREATRRM